MSVELARYRDLFFSEAHEQLASIAAALRKLDQTPGERSAFEAAFRASHTLKGMSATMGYDEVTVFAHAFEDLLQSARDQSKGASNAGIPPLFRTLDHLTGILSRLESGQSPDLKRDDTQEPSARAGMRGAPEEPSASVRVSSDRLGQMNTRIIELLASARRLAHAQANAEQDSGEAGWREHLSVVQQFVAVAWSMQMAPIGEVFDRFPRMLHDLARAERKEIRVTLEGEEIEIGRPLLEELAEPLLHLLRNAVAHGIEPLAERLTAGKNPRGTVFIRACQQGDSITIEVGDDGRGLDAQRILQTAFDQGLVSEDERRTLGEAEAYKLILLSGFSLSPVVTKSSGRGVGMDIVRKQVQALDGTMHIRSQPGVGTTFILQLPRTAGTSQVELVRVDDRIFALPAAQIDSRLALARDDLIRLPAGEIRVLDRNLRLIDLRSCFGLSPRPVSDPYGLLVTNNRAGIAVRVDEFLGKALWSNHGAEPASSVVLIDLDQLAHSF